MDEMRIRQIIVQENTAPSLLKESGMAVKEGRSGDNIAGSRSHSVLKGVFLLAATGKA